MGNLAFGDPRLAESAVITTSATVAASMPLSYLKKQQPTDKCRFIDSSAPISFDVDLTAAMAALGISQWNYVGLYNTNIDSVAATWQIVADTTQGGLATPDWDSTVLQAWPAPNMKPFWERVHSRLFIATPRTEPWLRFTIDNTTNALGYLDIGNLIIADAYSPTDCNANWGELPDWSEEEVVVSSEGGQDYPREMGVKGSYSLTIEPSGANAAADVYAKIQRIRRLRGSSKSVFVDLDPADSTYAMDNIVYGRLVSAKNLSMPDFQHFEISLSIKELR